MEIPEKKQIQLDFNVFSIASSPPRCTQDFVAVSFLHAIAFDGLISAIGRVTVNFD